MRLRFNLAVHCVTALLGISTTVSVVAAEKAQEATMLVQQLGSDKYQERQDGYERLLDLGELAFQAVEQGTRSSDAEIRLRSQQLLSALKSQRIEGYFNGTPWPETGQLVSIERFKQNVTGNDEEARAIFSELFRSNPKFVKLLEYDRERALESLNRYIEVYRWQWREYISAPDQEQLPISCLTLLYHVMAAERFDNQALILTASEARAEGAGEEFRDAFIAYIRIAWDDITAEEKATRVQNVYDFYRNRLEILPGDDKFRGVIRAQTLTPYLASRIASLQGDALPKNKRTATDIIYFFGKLGCAEIYPLAKRVLASPDFTSREKFGSVIAIGQYGTKDDIPTLEALLDDQSEYRRSRNGRYGFTIGDVALTAVIHLIGEEYADYNLVGATNGFSQSTFLNIAFPTKEDRDAAHEKWKARQTESQ